MGKIPRFKTIQTTDDPFVTPDGSTFVTLQTTGSCTIENSFSPTEKITVEGTLSLAETQGGYASLIITAVEGETRVIYHN